ncbi:carboxymuconolactone decarboxylase family protein [Ruegeria pomeroyi]|jgi:AhpD family alkylhydroperoxidase|uniref:4-carboxymuconolactone decarboxylase domain/alkylhydroperoxidase AhpD family core domain protein n=2 Tax=Ruegeria pomeroyi TaxID=89184 RepID=Q5LLX6_RUEPO|nr:carboxymuconolactone decarboxylase family protein [Ruegeria pomeroyi]AAV97009.1 4-carboxymuconolactone decarboxylase domain/alkylhydroperoxidase AhpD family core domain protein [Ruegeria pomeroyi DSS-3]NVK99163.1 carboxymuconolactone decarboxylase family protein [Ruegeria pomeroyi]NVL03683.1 carboxymuconolactone decarboxylase family protein [Ruegeria pomeroyi]QWV10535.1 carboxymuconolactone decarboxylase family protein [Ruegeria pomeroyi]
MSVQKEKLAQANKRLMGLFKADQKTMMAFKTLSDTAVREAQVSTAMKEMIAVAIAAARGCEDCILYHVNEAKSHGAERGTLVEVLAVAIEMSGGPGTVYAAKALDAFDQL